MTFESIIKSMAAKLSISVSDVKSPAPGKGGSFKTGNAGDAGLFAAALSESGVQARAVSRAGHHWVFIG